MRVGWFLLAAALPCAVAGQSVGHDLESAGKDFLHVWAAPGRLDSNDLPVLGVLAAGTALFIRLDQPVNDWFNDHPASFAVKVLTPFREGHPASFLGRSFVLAGGSMLLYGAGWAFDSRNLRDAGMGCASAALSATTIRSLVNHIVGRERPRLGHGPFRFELFTSSWNKHSFPAGHAAHLMSCVAFWNERFDLGAAEPALYAIAGGVALARMA